MKNAQKYLPHLINAVPNKGYGNRLSMYLIALEAWRRGLVIKFFLKDNPENKLLIRYSISNGENEYEFESSLGEKLTPYAYEVCQNKDETKKVLKAAGISVPEGQRFTSNIQNEEIINYACNLGFPLVIKPISENAGKGVFSNIKSEEEFKESLQYVRNELNYDDIIVEKHVEGIEHRIFLVDGKVIAATNRVPANIIGDGIHSINQLIELKNKSKQLNPTISSKPIEKDKEVTDSIRALGYDYSCIPLEDELIYLRTKSNVSAGGDAIDVTDELGYEWKRMAEDAMNTIEGLNVCGLDMIIDKESNQAAIIEINTKPMLGLHAFPVEGEPRDVISPIIDSYFPETKEKTKSILYFDFDAVLAPLRDRSVTQLELEPPPQYSSLCMNKYILSGTFQENFQKELRLLALEKQLHGYLNEIDENQYELVLAHEDEQIIVSFLDEIQRENLFFDTEIEKQDFFQPIKLGFETYKITGNRKRLQSQREIIRELNKELTTQKRKVKNYKKEIVADRRQNSKMGQRIRSLEKETNKKAKRIDKLMQKNVELKEEYQKLLDSNSWKFTKPIRTVERVFKKK